MASLFRSNALTIKLWLTVLICKDCYLFVFFVQSGLSGLFFAFPAGRVVEFNIVFLGGRFFLLRVDILPLREEPLPTSLKMSGVRLVLCFVWRS